MKKAAGQNITGPVVQRDQKLLTKKKCCVSTCKNTSDTENLIFFLVPISQFREKVFDAIEAGTGERPPFGIAKSCVYVCQVHYKLEEDVKFWNLCIPNSTRRRVQLKPGVVPHIFPSPEDPLVVTTNKNAGRASKKTGVNNATSTSGCGKRKLASAESEEGLYVLEETPEPASSNLQVRPDDLASCSKQPRISEQQQTCETNPLPDQDTHPQDSWQDHACSVCTVASKKKTAFPCPRCNFVLRCPIALERHLVKRHKCTKAYVEVQSYLIALTRKVEAQHKCLLCKGKVRFATLEALQSHVNSDHRLCNVCGMTWKSNATQHTQEHTRQFKSVFQCSGCYFESPFQQNVLGHVCQQHGNGIYFVMETEGRRGFDCPYCHYSTSCAKVLEIHAKNHGEKKCVVCDKKFIPSAKCVACDLLRVCRKCQPKKKPTTAVTRVVQGRNYTAVMNYEPDDMKSSQSTNCDTNSAQLTNYDTNSSQSSNCDTNSAQLTNCDTNSAPITNCDTNSAQPTNFEPMEPEFISVDKIKQEPVEYDCEIQTKQDEFDLKNEDSDIENPAHFCQVQIKEEPNEFDPENGERNSPNIENPADYCQVEIKEEVTNEFDLENGVRNPSNIENPADLCQVEIKDEVTNEFDLENGIRNSSSIENPADLCQVEMKEDEIEFNADYVKTEQETDFILGSITPNDESDGPYHCTTCKITHNNPKECYISNIIIEETLLKSLPTKSAGIKREIQVLEILRKFLLTKVKERRLSQFMVNQFKEIITLSIKVDKVEQCFWCGLYLNSIPEVYDHVLISHKSIFTPSPHSEFKMFLKPLPRTVEWYSCLLCIIKVRSVVDLFFHVNKLHNYCRLCGDSCLDHKTGHELEIIRHPYQCHVCDVSLHVDLNTFQQHFRKHPRCIVPQPDNFNCPYCQFHSTSVGNLSFHLKYHRLQTCAVCQGKFVTHTKCVVAAKANMCYRCNDFEIVRNSKYEDHLGTIANVVVIKDTNVQCFEGTSRANN